MGCRSVKGSRFGAGEKKRENPYMNHRRKRKSHYLNLVVARRITLLEKTRWQILAGEERKGKEKRWEQRQKREGKHEMYKRKERKMDEMMFFN